jgi:hypothetical protein
MAVCYHDNAPKNALFCTENNGVFSVHSSSDTVSPCCSI